MGRFVPGSLRHLSTTECDLGTVYFTSMALRALTAKNGFSFPDSQIIYCGIDYDRFYTPVHARATKPNPYRWCSAGRLHPDKGIETACKAAMRCLIIACSLIFMVMAMPST